MGLSSRLQLALNGAWRNIVHSRHMHAFLSLAKHRATASEQMLALGELWKKMH